MGIGGMGKFDTTEFCSFRREVDEERKIQLRRFQVRTHLGIIRFTQNLDRLELDDHPSFNEQVQPVSTHFLAIVVNQNLLFHFDGEVMFAQFDDQGTAINGFQKPWTKGLMYTNYTEDDSIGQVIVMIGLHPRIPQSPSLLSRNLIRGSSKVGPEPAIGESAEPTVVVMTCLVPDTDRRIV
jgi:hypothetical protein